MNINMQGLSFMSYPQSKATADRMERQQKRDNTIAFYEQQKENLKNMKTDSIEDIQRKLGMLENYNDQINAAKFEYNHSQMFHVLDEAMERAEKISEEAEKYAPKTPEERLEDMIEEATGVDKDAGMMSDMMDELTELAEDMTEEMTEELEEVAQEKESAESMEQVAQSKVEELNALTSKEQVEKYKRIDYRI